MGNDIGSGSVVLTVLVSLPFNHPPYIKVQSAPSMTSWSIHVLFCIILVDSFPELLSKIEIFKHLRFSKIEVFLIPISRT